MQSDLEIEHTAKAVLESDKQRLSAAMKELGEQYESFKEKHEQIVKGICFKTAYF